MEVKVLGPGCKNCAALEDNTRQALESLHRSDEVTKVDDVAEIAAYGVMRTPALVVDDTVLVSGRVPDAAEVRSLLVAAGIE